MSLSLFGDVASIAGSFIAIVGFVVTIGSVWKAKNAAEEARQAARDAVARIKTQIVAQEVAGSLRLVREIDAYCRDGLWQRAVVRCEDARVALSRLDENEQLTPEERGEVFEWMGQLPLLLALIQRKRSQEERGLSTEKQKQVHAIIICMSKIQARLEATVVEVQNGGCTEDRSTR